MSVFIKLVHINQVSLLNEHYIDKSIKKMAVP